MTTFKVKSSMPCPGNRNELSIKKITTLLGAMCLFLSAIEYMIPKPFPFLRTGIANFPLMLALDILPFRSFIILLAIKVFGQAILTGTLFSYIFLFSLCGVTISGLLMYAMRKLLGNNISLVGLGVLGAFSSNLAQMILGWSFIFGNNVLYIAPPFLAVSLVSGLAVGLFSQYFICHSRWYGQILHGEQAK